MTRYSIKLSVNDDLRDIIVSAAKEANLPVSKYVLSLIVQDLMIKGGKDYFHDLIQAQLMREALQRKMKQDSSDMYLVKNSVRRVLDMAHTDQSLIGNINMEKIRNIKLQ